MRVHHYVDLQNKQTNKQTNKKPAQREWADAQESLGYVIVMEKAYHKQNQSLDKVSKNPAFLELTLYRPCKSVGHLQKKSHACLQPFPHGGSGTL